MCARPRSSLRVSDSPATRCGHMLDGLRAPAPEVCAAFSSRVGAATPTGSAHASAGVNTKLTLRPDHLSRGQ